MGPSERSARPSSRLAFNNYNLLVNTSFVVLKTTTDRSNVLRSILSVLPSPSVTYCGKATTLRNPAVMRRLDRLSLGLVPSQAHRSRVHSLPTRLDCRPLSSVSEAHPSTARLSRFEPEQRIDYAEFRRMAELGRRL